MPEDLTRPANLPAKDLRGGLGWKPAEYDADLAAAAMASEMVKRLGTPSIVSKKFVVYHGIWQGLNHTDKNETGYDASLRIAVYDHVASESVNVNGKYFDSFWAFMMKPKYIIQGMPTGGQFEEDKPSIFERVANWIRGSKPTGEQK